jgi:hypothetical protein
MPDEPTPTPTPTPTPEPAPTPPSPPPAPPPEPAPPAEVALDYSGLSAPDIFHLEAADLDAVKTTLAQHKVPPAAAAELLGKLGEQQERLLAAYNTEAETAQKKQAADWLEQAKVDPAIGGQAFEANYALANQTLNQFADESFRTWLDETGLRNFPPLLRMFHAIAKATGEAPLLAGLPAAGATVDPMKAMYPNSPALWAENQVARN